MRVYIPSQIVEGESILKDSNSIAYAFDNYFANIGKDLAELDRNYQIKIF